MLINYDESIRACQHADGWKFSNGALKLLSNLVQADIIEPVSGHGKLSSLNKKP